MPDLFEATPDPSEFEDLGPDFMQRLQALREGDEVDWPGQDFETDDSAEAASEGEEPKQKKTTADEETRKRLERMEERLGQIPKPEDFAEASTRMFQQMAAHGRRMHQQEQDQSGPQAPEPPKIDAEALFDDPERVVEAIQKYGSYLEDKIRSQYEPVATNAQQQLQMMMPLLQQAREGVVSGIRKQYEDAGFDDWDEVWPMAQQVLSQASDPRVQLRPDAIEAAIFMAQKHRKGGNPFKVRAGEKSKPRSPVSSSAPSGGNDNRRAAAKRALSPLAKKMGRALGQEFEPSDRTVDNFLSGR